MHSNKTATENSKSSTNGHGHYAMVGNGYPHPLPSTKIDDGRIYAGVPTSSSHNNGMTNKVREINVNGTATAWTKKSLENVSFIPQRGENNCAHELTLQKDTRTNCEKFALYSAIVGLVFVLSAIIW